MFDLKIEELLDNPMCSSTIQQLHTQGKSNARQLLATAITDAAGEQGFRKPDGGVLFPKNLAIIAEMQAKK